MSRAITTAAVCAFVMGLCAGLWLRALAAAGKPVFLQGMTPTYVAEFYDSWESV